AQEGDAAPRHVIEADHIGGGAQHMPQHALCALLAVLCGAVKHHAVHAPAVNDWRPRPRLSPGWRIVRPACGHWQSASLEVLRLMCSPPCNLTLHTGNAAISGLSTRRRLRD